MAEAAREYPICTFVMDGDSHTLFLEQRDWDILNGDDFFLPGCRSISDTLRESETVSWQEMASSVNYVVRNSMAIRELFNYNYTGIMDPVDGKSVFAGFDGRCRDKGPATCILDLYKDASTEKQTFVGSIDVRHHAFSPIAGLDGLKVRKKSKTTRLFEKLDELLEFLQSGSKRYPEVTLTDKKIAPDLFC